MKRAQVHGPAQDGDLAEVADEQQVLEVRGDRGEVLERLDGLLAPLGVARAQRRSEDLLEQRGLAVGGGAKDAQVAPADAEAGELVDGAHDLALGVVEEGLAVATLPADHAVLLELADELRIGAGLLDDVAHPVQGPAAGDRHARPAKRARIGPATRARDRLGFRATGGELLTDHAKRQELVALEPQDRPQAGHVDRRVEPVSAARPARREQLLILEVADLRDRDVRKLALELLAHRADRERLLRRDGRRLGQARGRAGERRLRGTDVDARLHHPRKVSLYLPICSSSPSRSLCDSIRCRLTYVPLSELLSSR